MEDTDIPRAAKKNEHKGDEKINFSDFLQNSAFEPFTLETNQPASPDVTHLVSSLARSILNRFNLSSIEEIDTKNVVMHLNSSLGMEIDIQY
jgi:hypothetical protein